MRIEELLKILEMDNITLKLEPQIYLGDFKKALICDGWSKIHEDVTNGSSNFWVIFRKGDYEMEIFCDPDAYVIDVTIRKISEEGSKEKTEGS
jgi:hypothetical protein